MNKIIKYFLGILAMASPAMAQDFYNGCRGPKTVQVDSYTTLSDGNVSGTIIPKIFPRNLGKTLPDLVLAVPFSVSADGVRNEGVNLGVIVNGDTNNFIGAVGLFRDEEGYNILKPQLYFTHIDGPWTLDLEGSLPINLRNGKMDGSFSTTLGYGFGRFRIGGYATEATNSGFDYGGNVRFEMVKDHKYWIQVKLSPDNLGVRLAANF